MKINNKIATLLSSVMVFTILVAPIVNGGAQLMTRYWSG